MASPKLPAKTAEGLLQRLASALGEVARPLGVRSVLRSLSLSDPTEACLTELCQDLKQRADRRLPQTSHTEIELALGVIISLARSGSLVRLAAPRNSSHEVRRS